MTPVRTEILRLLEEMSQRYPEWRLGQMIANVALWAKQPTSLGDTGLWDLEDEDMLAAIRRHLVGPEAIANAEIPNPVS
jgi:hypothetical protein